MLEQISKEIDLKIADEREWWIKDSKRISAAIEHEQAVLKSDEAQTDRSENIVYQTAIENYNKLQFEKRDVQQKTELYSIYQETYSSNYTPQGFIDVGSTVRLILGETGEEFVVKVVPEGIAGAIVNKYTKAVPVSAKLGANLLQKKEGDIVTIRTDRNVKYTIVEVY